MDDPAGFVADGTSAVSRRAVMKGGAATVAIGTLAPAAVARAQSEPAGAVAPVGATAAVDRPLVTVPVSMTINGQHRAMQLDARATLLDTLREHLHLTGSKKGCDHGQCGACTVLADGERINACLSLAVTHDGGEVTTIEGLAHGDTLHPMQAAFLAHDGYQCGYCTPGQICSAIGALREHAAGSPSWVTTDMTVDPPLTDIELRERMSGNICRCSAYPNIMAAIRAAEGQAA